MQATSPCPRCNQGNEPRAEYCWACHLDLKPDGAPPLLATPPPVVATPRRPAGPDELELADVPTSPPRTPPRATSAPSAGPTPVARTRRRRPSTLAPDEAPAMSYCLAMTLAAALVVGGSWFALELMQKRVSPGMFAGGWVALLAVTYLLNRILPKAPVEAEAYAPKLFSTRDNHNRELLATKVALFVPNIVLHAVTSWFELLVPRRR